MEGRPADVAPPAPRLQGEEVPVRLKHRRVKRLGCRPTLDARLRAGESIPELARWLQETQEECGDVSRGSLVTILARYRKDLLAGRNMSAQEAEKKRDELETLEELYWEQKRRFKAAREADIGGERLTDAPTRELRAAVEILSRRHAVRMDLGIGRGATEDIESDGGGEALSPDLRRRILRVLQDLRRRQQLLEAHPSRES